MPQALAFIAPSAFGVGGSLALVTATGLTVGGYLVSVAGTLLLNTAVNALFAPKATASPKPEDIKLNVNQAIGARLKHYGTVRAGGTRTFIRARDGKLYRVIAHGHGEISQILQYFIDKKEVTLNVDGEVQEDQYQFGGRSRLVIKTRPGQIPQTAYGEITAIWPDYDADHRLNGLWTSLTIAEQVPNDKFYAMYPNGEPQIEIVAQTTRLRDPRSQLIAYSENAALIVADFIQSPDGFNRSGALNEAALTEAANESDQAIALAAGGTEPRYRLCGTYALTERPGDVLQRMLDAFGGEVRLLPDASIGIYTGVWRAPTVTLTIDDLLELQEIDDGPDKLDRYNELPFTYVDPDLGFQQVTGDPWIDEARSITEGEIAVGDLADFNYSPSHGQGRRVAKIKMSRDNPARRVTAMFKPSALEAAYERVVTLDMPDVGLVGDFYIKSYQIEIASSNVLLQMSEADASAYTFAPSEEGAPQLPPDEDVSGNVPAPSGFAASGSGVLVAQNTYAAGIDVAWEAPSDVLNIRLQYSYANADQWITVPVDNAATSVTISPLLDGFPYDVRLGFSTGAVFDFSNPSTTSPTFSYAVIEDVTASADTSPPAAPTGLTVTDLTGGNAQVDMIASASAGIWKTEIYRDAALVATFYTSPAEPVSFVDASGSGTFDWTARSINVSDVQNTTDAGPVTQTIT